MDAMSPRSSKEPPSGDGPPPEPAQLSESGQRSESGQLSTLYSIRANDPDRSWTDTQGMSQQDLDQISELMNALGDLRRTERDLSEASRRFMKLNETDMRAIHYLTLCANQNVVATPGSIARHLGISTASTTKLLNRLQAGGHTTRSEHPSDRRALAVSVTQKTHQAAIETVGRQQAKRIHAAARLSPQEREIVIGFVRDMTAEISPEGEPWASDH